MSESPQRELIAREKALVRALKSEPLDSPARAWLWERLAEVVRLQKQAYPK